MQRNRQSDRVQTRGAVRLADREMPTPLVELCRQIRADDRIAVLMQMAAGLEPEEQLDLLEQIAVRLPADLRRQWEEDLRTRSATCST